MQQNNEDNLCNIKDDFNFFDTENYKRSGLNPKYTFDNFVVGNSNKFATEVAYAVAEAPAKLHNPLYIYGKTGLGKTHLINAIGNKIIKDNSKANVLYFTSDMFYNELMNDIKKGKIGNIINKCKGKDVLIFDDVQFIAGKKICQEAFFMIFNHLYYNGKQIIISSDILPREISPLYENLKSRCEWGMIAELSEANYETRLEILKRKVEEKNIIVSDEILSIIATRINSNIMELEGILNRIVAYANLNHNQITTEIAENILNDYIKQK